MFLGKMKNQRRKIKMRVRVFLTHEQALIFSVEIPKISVPPADDPSEGKEGVVRPQSLTISASLPAPKAAKTGNEPPKRLSQTKLNMINEDQACE